VIAAEKADPGTLAQILTTSRSNQEKIAAARQLGTMGSTAVGALIPGLRDPSMQVRIAVVQALGNIGPAAKESERWLRQGYDWSQRVSSIPTPEELKRAEAEKPFRDAITAALLRMGVR